MEDPTTRKTRLQALRAAATAAGGGEDGDGAALVEPVLKFRNYAPAADERIQHEKLEPARVPEFEEVKVDADAVLVGDAEEVLINVAPKKANWDLRRDIADKLARLERQTQGAMIKLTQQENQLREEAPPRKDEEGEAWERPRMRRTDVARRTPTALPVRAPDEDGEWLAAEQGWMAAAPAAAGRVEGITVVDDLAQEQAAQRLESQHDDDEEQQQQKQLQEQQRRRQAQRQKSLPGLASGMAALKGMQSQEARRRAAKQQLATAAQQLLQDPDKQLPQLKALLELLQDEDAQVCRLAMLTLLAVFKDLLPAYRIRPAHDEEPDKLSKEVRALRAYEASLLESYHSYLKGLQRAFKRSSAGHEPAQQGRIAIKCMAALLEAAPHFNYRSDLLQVLVSCLPNKDHQIRQTAQRCLSTLLASSHGVEDVATEAVQLIADLVRRQKCVVPPTTLDCLLNLRFPDVTAPVPAAEPGHKRKKRKKAADDDVDRSFLEAQAAADLASRRHNQTATLEALFEMLFRVLKTCCASGLVHQETAAALPRAQFLNKFPLLFPALRLLSTYLHLISVEYVQDVSLELRRLLQSSALPPQERLRILLTAAEMMQRQGSSVSVEHAGFLTEAYMALQHAVLSPLLEPLPAAGSKAAAAAGGEQDDKEGEQLLAGMLSLQEQTGTKAGEQVCFLVPKVLEALVLESRTLDAARQGAFVKRMLASAAAAGDTGLAMGLLCLVHRCMRRSRRLQGMLLHEVGGPAGQGYQPEAADPSEAGALGVPLWELSLLARHYHPHVAAASAQVAVGNTTGLLPLAGGSSSAAALAYSTAAGGFRPAPSHSK
ncbi:nucleolar complex 3-like protein isoform X2 [Micractinium conductrix]|uniref:Nucleolar complex 3-like protein isoform X2 n=1 Tax=Micractinium conductrix TaxID=554055 RepID=A0A2P6VKE8_9CHLO|nr:nucleolar complex 3-like protein isoform X2 [Micractinium conductrix]|eukprot:PSC74530.1 nucleolar complex 3-like protein isoform X2 [Micractinium conductrix]